MIQEGAFADLLFVEGDPLTDINCVCDMSCHRVILKNGIRVSEPVQED